MNFGFVINNRTCIGCHACSTACKSENEVPLGVSRTWVKYVEAGTYPDSKRHFQVTRCNHCENPPCARICPVTAMYQRDDGIVEFDPDVCIGCKACMQACPYDAIHVDPDTKTIAKCHYCSHRVDIGLEPACVVVCPEHSIIAGDLDDPTSEISQVLAKERTSVRKPEQGTGPKLFYIEGHDISMHPTATDLPQTFMWADVLDDQVGVAGANEHQAKAKPSSSGTSVSGTPLRQPSPQGAPAGGPIRIAGRIAEQMVQVGYNAQHVVPWHWPVPAYLVTKGIAAGWFALYAMASLFGVHFSTETTMVGGLTAVIFLGITTVFLVMDLERPERFLWILIRPQWRSWLTRGAVILIGFTTIMALWVAIEAGEYFEIFGAVGFDIPVLRPYVWVVGTVFAIATAVYTAFLFGQAEGRDLWQSGLLPIHLVVQAAMAGAACMLLLDFAWPQSAEVNNFAFNAFVAAVVLDLFVTFFGEFGMPHMTDGAAKAAHEITHGAFKNHFWWGSIVLGHLIPLALLLTGNMMAAGGAGLAALVGLYFFEYAYVMAPQRIPNS